MLNKQIGFMEVTQRLSFRYQEVQHKALKTWHVGMAELQTRNMKCSFHVLAVPLRLVKGVWAQIKNHSLLCCCCVCFLVEEWFCFVFFKDAIL